MTITQNEIKKCCDAMDSGVIKNILAKAKVGETIKIKYITDEKVINFIAKISSINEQYIIAYPIEGFSCMEHIYISNNSGIIMNGFEYFVSEEQ